MSTYLLNFIVYTAAMVGVICLAVVVYKKSTTGFRASKSKFISVEERLNISPRKTLYVIRAGNEQFLIAGDADKTTLISQLGGGKYTEPGNYTEPTEYTKQRQIAARHVSRREPVELPDITQDLPDVVDLQQLRDNRTTGILKRIVNI